MTARALLACFGVALLLAIRPLEAAARAAVAPPGETPAPTMGQAAPAGSGKAAPPAVKPGEPEQDADQEGRSRARGFRLEWRNRPSLRVGSTLRMDFRLKLQGDFRGFSPKQDLLEDVFDFSRRRVGVQGTLLRRIEYEVERELERDDRPWRDAFVNVRFARSLEVQAGKFKIPFSPEQLTGGSNLDFVSRSLIAHNLAPARDRGVMAHGRLLRQGRLDYQAGLFAHGGEIGRPAEAENVGATLAARVTTTAGVDGLRLGGALTTGSLPEGRNGLPGRGVAGYRFFEPVYVRGRRLRLGAEAAWSSGPYAVRTEMIRVRDDRTGQGLGDDDLEPAIASGWYVSGTWVLTGERKGGDVEPRRPFLRGGMGALEATARIERLGYGGGAAVGEPFRNPRASNILESASRVWTAGLNWYANRWVKIQLNGVHERFSDPERTPVAGRAGFWSWVLRAQFVL